LPHSLHGREENLISYNVIDRQPEGKRPLGKPRCRWEDTTEIYLKKYDLRL
jgi:hypothetical protein